MKRRLSVFLLAVLAVFVFAGCSSNDPVKTTPESVPATQVPNDADQGGGAGGTSDKNNDGTPDSTPDPDERVEDGLDDVKQDVENGVDDVKDGVIYQTVPYVIPTGRTTLSSGNWSIDGLKNVTAKVAMICTNAAELNKLKNSLENDVKSSIRNIDKYIAIGDNKKAEELQYALNNKSMRSSYVFKCSVIFQSYVTQISTMLVDAWHNILE